jgi:hypothetical protein
MPVLHQILAVEKGAKNRATSLLTEIHKANQKDNLFNGQTREYHPFNSDGENLAGENVLVQRNAPDVFKQVQKVLGELFTVTAQRDYTNCNARADVKLDDGTVLVKDAPATYLLFLEKQLVDVRTLINEMPVLDPAYTWVLDENSNLFRSNTVESTRTVKMEAALVLLEPTKEHPGKAEKVVRDVGVGTWKTTKVSGALKTPRKSELLERVEEVLKAVKFAREQANTVEVGPTPLNGILGWILR